MQVSLIQSPLQNEMGLMSRRVTVPHITNVLVNIFKYMYNLTEYRETILM